MTLTQLGAFVLVARLGSVRAAAQVLGVSEPAVSQALAALRKHLDDDLLVRAAGGMTLTDGGQRLITIASQIVSLGAEAESAVRAAQGAPEQLRVVASSEIAELCHRNASERECGRVAAQGDPVQGAEGITRRKGACRGRDQRIHRNPATLVTPAVSTSGAKFIPRPEITESYRQTNDNRRRQNDDNAQDRNT